MRKSVRGALVPSKFFFVTRRGRCTAGFRRFLMGNLQRPTHWQMYSWLSPLLDAQLALYSKPLRVRAGLLSPRQSWPADATNDSPRQSWPAVAAAGLPLRLARLPVHLVVGALLRRLLARSRPDRSQCCCRCHCCRRCHCCHCC